MVNGCSELKSDRGMNCDKSSLSHSLSWTVADDDSIGNVFEKNDNLPATSGTDEDGMSEDQFVEENRLLSNSAVSTAVSREPTAELLSPPQSTLPDKLDAFLRDEYAAGRNIWELEEWRTVSHDSLPDWLQDNGFLVNEHRPPLHSYFQCFRSIFRLHTETGNIWTHLIGFIIFLLIAVDFVARRDIVWQEKAVLGVFFVSSTTCFLFSWTFHAFFCHSKSVGHFFCKLDYVGIVTATIGSFVPWIYYCYHCRQLPQLFYLLLFACLGGSVIVYIFVSFDDFIERRGVRAGVFAALGLSGLVFTLHFMFLYGFVDAFSLLPIKYLFLMAALYVTGAVVFVKRFPECYWPGKFDVWFSSHQWSHVIGFLATLLDYHLILMVVEHRLEYGGCLES